MSDGNIQMTNVAGPRVDPRRAGTKLTAIGAANAVLQQRRQARRNLDAPSLKVARAMDQHLRSAQSATTSVALGNALAAMHDDFPDEDEFGGDVQAASAASEIFTLVGQLLVLNY